MEHAGGSASGTPSQPRRAALKRTEVIIALNDRERENAAHLPVVGGYEREGLLVGEPPLEQEHGDGGATRRTPILEEWNLMLLTFQVLTVVVVVLILWIMIDNASDRQRRAVHDR